MLLPTDVKSLIVARHAAPSRDRHRGGLPIEDVVPAQI